MSSAQDGPPEETEYHPGQHQFLDPAATSFTGTWKPTGALPRAVRDFGKFPAVSLWQPGDLLLIGAVRPGWVARKIIQTQETQFAITDACWHHAAVYMGDEQNVCEATV